MYAQVQYAMRYLLDFNACQSYIYIYLLTCIQPHESLCKREESCPFARCFPSAVHRCQSAADSWRINRHRNKRGTSFSSRETTIRYRSVYKKKKFISDYIPIPESTTKARERLIVPSGQSKRVHNSCAKYNSNGNVRIY